MSDPKWQEQPPSPPWSRTFHRLHPCFGHPSSLGKLHIHSSDTNISLLLRAAPLLPWRLRRLCHPVRLVPPLPPGLSLKVTSCRGHSYPQMRSDLCLVCVQDAHHHVEPYTHLLLIFLSPPLPPTGKEAPGARPLPCSPLHPGTYSSTQHTVGPACAGWMSPGNRITFVPCHPAGSSEAPGQEVCSLRTPEGLEVTMIEPPM